MLMIIFDYMLCFNYNHRAIIIKVALSKGCIKRTTGQNEMIFNLSIREEMETGFAKKKVQILTGR